MNQECRGNAPRGFEDEVVIEMTDKGVRDPLGRNVGREEKQAIQIGTGKGAMLQGVSRRGEIEAVRAGGSIRRESRGAGLCNGIVLNTMTAANTFEMSSLFRHAPDITVPLAAPKESQDGEPQHHVAKRESSHSTDQELFDRNLYRKNLVPVNLNGETLWPIFSGVPPCPVLFDGSINLIHAVVA